MYSWMNEGTRIQTLFISVTELPASAYLNAPLREYGRFCI
jgi:hypothetical protein